MGYSKSAPFNAQTVVDAVKPYLEKVQPYLETAWAHLEPHHRDATGRINALFHGYEPWQVLAIAAASTLILMKVTSSLLRWGFVLLIGLLAVSLLPLAAKLAKQV
ncbi:hypothetical protein WJX81_002859 [Elliptochloris bilobata]|uniref:Uncharacterized protein n=1 Tax=Elliptochloris bilobata TaxID=381761 RepID=A0AAW1QZX5_9CHLO